MGMCIEYFFRIIQFLQSYYNSMSTSQKVQKKNKLKTKMTDTHEEQNYNYMVEKQLQDDFKVHQYLHEHPNEGHNMEQYIALLNNILVKKQEKNKRKELLKKTTKILRQDKSHEEYQPNPWSDLIPGGKTVDHYYSEEEFIKIKKELEIKQENIQERTHQEEEMSRILHKEISDKKKSLNLLKGDIGHMIARNQSISVLESKVNKVSLVSQNQLKRVSIALSKDKEEVQLRLQMQKRFHKKLKGVQNSESKNLKKVKLSYLQSMNRRKQIYDRLNLIEKQCASVEQYSDQLKQKEQKNLKSIAAFKLLKFICNSIDQVFKLWQKFMNKEQNIHAFTSNVKKIFENKIDRSTMNTDRQITIDDIEESELYEMINKIIDQFHSLQYAIYERKKEYGQLMNSIEEQWQKMVANTHKTSQIVQELKMQEIIELQNSGFSFYEYFRKFKLLQLNYAVLYKLFDFFNKKMHHFDGMYLVSSIYSNECYLLKFQQDDGSYQFDNEILEEIQKYLQNWFDILTITIKQSRYRVDRIVYDYKTKPKVYLQDSSDLNQLICLRYNNIQKTQCSEYPPHSQFNGRHQFQDFEAEENANDAMESLRQSDWDNKKKQQYKKMEQQAAKRVQLLERIDQSYYSMIKETIVMEKENTKKNYEFQRNFKRNKYSSQDQLLEQKRFEATFSSLFKQDPDDSVRQSKEKFKGLKGKTKANKQNKFSRTALTSLHNHRSAQKKHSQSFVRYSGLESYKKNITFWEKQKKMKLGKKLQQIFDRV